MPLYRLDQDVKYKHDNAQEWGNALFTCHWRVDSLTGQVDFFSFKNSKYRWYFGGGSKHFQGHKRKYCD